MTNTNFDEDTGEQYGDAQDEAVQGDGLVAIQWRQGDIKAETPGYFYLSGKNLPEGFTPGDPWVQHREFFESTNTREDGWKAEALPAAIICARSQPYLRAPKGSDAGPEWLEAWPKGNKDAAMHCDVLLVARGLEDLGPVKWSTGGTTTAFAIIGRADPKKDPRGGILAQQLGVLQAADKAAKIAYREKKRLYWLFWLTIASERDAKNKVLFTQTPGKAVTRPAAVLPTVIDTAWLKATFVGAEMAAYGNEMREAFAEWKATKRTNDAPAKATGRNVPQPIEDDLL